MIQTLLIRLRMIGLPFLLIKKKIQTKFKLKTEKVQLMSSPICSDTLLFLEHKLTEDTLKSKTGNTIQKAKEYKILTIPYSH